MCDFIYKNLTKTENRDIGSYIQRSDHHQVWTCVSLRSPVSAPGGGGGGVRGVFVSITEQQTGPLEMKGSEWSQSKTGPAGDCYPTDSSGLGLGPRRMNDPLVMDKEHLHTHTVRITVCFIGLVCSHVCFFQITGAYLHSKSKNRCKQTPGAKVKCCK